VKICDRRLFEAENGPVLPSANGPPPPRSRWASAGFSGCRLTPPGSFDRAAPRTRHRSVPSLLRGARSGRGIVAHRPGRRSGRVLAKSPGPGFGLQTSGFGPGNRTSRADRVGPLGGGQTSRVHVGTESVEVELRAEPNFSAPESAKATRRSMGEDPGPLEARRLKPEARGLKPGPELCNDRALCRARPTRPDAPPPSSSHPPRRLRILLPANESRPVHPVVGRPGPVPLRPARGSRRCSGAWQHGALPGPGAGLLLSL